MKIITQEQMDEVFKNLSVIISLRDLYESEKNETMYQKYLSEFCAMFSVISIFGLDNEWYAWRIENEPKVL